MSNLDITHPQLKLSPTAEAVVVLKLWAKNKTDGGWELIREIESLEINEVPIIYVDNDRFFRRQHQSLDKNRLTYSYIEIRTVNLCSKCHVNPKAPPSFPVRPFDHWCDQCLTETPLTRRIRKSSRGEKRKLIEEQQRAKEKKAELRSAYLAEQQRRQAELAKNKKLNSSRQKRKKGLDLPLSLNLDFGEIVVESAPLILAIDIDAVAQRIDKAQDPTIFDEEFSDD